MVKIGDEISKVLEEVEVAILMHDDKIDFTDMGLLAATNIFTSVLLSRLSDLQKNEKMELVDALVMAEKLGAEIRSLVKVYADVDIKCLADELFTRE